MSKDEAIYWMRLGARCAHKYFGTGEWISIDEGGMYILEDGIRCTPEEFWSHRTEPYWLKDWDFTEDPYTCIAAREYSCPISEVTSAMREVIKVKYFAAAYGMYSRLFY